MKKVILIVSILAVAVLGVVILLLTGQSQPKAPMYVFPKLFKINFSFSNPPLLNHSTNFIVTISPVVNAYDVEVEFFKLPAGIELESGELHARMGNITANETAQHVIQLRITKTGVYRISLSISTVSENTSFTQTDGLYISVQEEGVNISKYLPNNIPSSPMIEGNTNIL